MKIVDKVLLENDVFEDVKDIMRATKQSRSKLYKDMQAELLERPIKLGRKSVWLRSQRIEYMAKLMNVARH